MGSNLIEKLNSTIKDRVVFLVYENKTSRKNTLLPFIIDSGIVDSYFTHPLKEDKHKEGLVLYYPLCSRTIGEREIGVSYNIINEGLNEAFSDLELLKENDVREPIGFDYAIAKGRILSPIHPLHEQIKANIQESFFPSVIGAYKTHQSQVMLDKNGVLISGLEIGGVTCGERLKNRDTISRGTVVNSLGKVFNTFPLDSEEFSQIGKSYLTRLD